MALGERFKGGGTRGIARFLAEHQNCDAGFDVRREDEPGSGKLRITCLGCGGTVSYRAGEAGDLGSAILDAPGTNGSSHPLAPAVEPAEPAEGASAAGTAAPPAATSGQRRVGPPGPKPAGRPGPAKAASGPPGPAAPASRGGRVPRWIPTAVITLLIGGGLTMIVLGLLREDDGGQGAQSAAPPPTQPAAPPGQSQPAQPTPPAQPAKPPAAEAPASPELRRRTFAGRFAIGVPAGWTSGGDAPEGFSFEPRGGDAGVRVFFEEGGRPLGELATLAGAFLEDAHSGASVGAPERVRFAGGPAGEVGSTYAGGEEVAFVLSRGGFSYLVLRRVDRGADAAAEREAEAVTASFRPRLG